MNWYGDRTAFDYGTQTKQTGDEFFKEKEKLADVQLDAIDPEQTIF